MLDPFRNSALILAACVATHARPDVILPPPEGMKAVSRSIRVALSDPDGPWIAGRRIRDGDTFGGLAERELGDAALSGWLTDLNDDADPRRLRIDQLIWMPRRGAVGDDAAWLVYVDTSRALQMSVRPFEPAADGRDHASALILVRPEHRRAFEGCFGEDGFERLAALEKDGYVTRVALDGLPDRFVPRDSDVDRVEVDGTLRADGNGEPQLAVEAVRYLDANGRPSSAPRVAGSGSLDVAPPLPWWLALVAFGGAAGLALLAVRRARASGSA